MDQFVFYRSLQRRYPDADIRMDICNLNKVEHNGFELDKVFGIERNECSKWQLLDCSDITPFSLPCRPLFRLVNKIQRDLLKHRRNFIMIDDASHYYQELYDLNPKQKYCIFGNFLNEKYRDGIEEKLKNDFSFNLSDLSEANSVVLEKIRSTNSVSIHIRRGDFKSRNVPVLGLEYYRDAMGVIEARVNDPHFFVFSDDSAYVRENFTDHRFTLVDNNRKDKSYLDMYLMSNCKHNIIANSGFSFWGAWLNRNSNKVVVAPNRNVPSCKETIADKSWVVIDAKFEV